MFTTKRKFSYIWPVFGFFQKGPCIRQRQVHSYKYIQCNNRMSKREHEYKRTSEHKWNRERGNCQSEQHIKHVYFESILFMIEDSKFYSWFLFAISRFRSAIICRIWRFSYRKNWVVRTYWISLTFLNLLATLKQLWWVNVEGLHKMFVTGRRFDKAVIRKFRITFSKWICVCARVCSIIIMYLLHVYYMILK